MRIVGICGEWILRYAADSLERFREKYKNRIGCRRIVIHSLCREPFDRAVVFC